MLTPLQPNCPNPCIYPCPRTSGRLSICPILPPKGVLPPLFSFLMLTEDSQVRLDSQNIYGQSFFNTPKALNCICTRYHLDYTSLLLQGVSCLWRASYSWGFISLGRAEKVRENQIKGAHPPRHQLPLLSPWVQTLSPSRSTTVYFYLFILQLTKRRRLFLMCWFRGSKRLASLASWPASDVAVRLPNWERFILIFI